MSNVISYLQLTSELFSKLMYHRNVSDLNFLDSFQVKTSKTDDGFCLELNNPDNENSSILIYSKLKENHINIYTFINDLKITSKKPNTCSCGYCYQDPFVEFNYEMEFGSITVEPFILVFKSYFKEGFKNEYYQKK